MSRNLNGKNYTMKNAKTMGFKNLNDGGIINGDLDITGDITIQGNIFQNGEAYETHIEHLFTEKDLITLRDGALSGLGAGEYAGFIFEKYDGTNDGYLVVGNDGVARVGDIGGTQAILTRDESGNLVANDIMVWDAATGKAIGKTLAELNISAIGHTHLIANITDFTDNSTNWNTAYGWGDHSLAGYLVATGVSYNNTNWDTAYGWGDHSLGGYITSFTEIDPIFVASDAFGIGSGDIIDWDAAYGWGDHADTYVKLDGTSTITRTTTGDALRIEALPTELDISIHLGLAGETNSYKLKYWGTGSGNTNDFSIESSTKTLFRSSQDGIVNFPNGLKLNGTTVSIVGHTHVIASITDFTDNSTNWNTAYGWGDHASGGYAADTNVSNWDTAYTYSQVGHLPLAGGTITGNVTIYKGTSTSPELYFQNATYKMGIDFFNNTKRLRFIDRTDVASRIEFDMGTGEIYTGASKHWHAGNFTDNHSNWDTAYSWGDHSTEGYITGYTETDPIYSAWNKSTGISITESQISDLAHVTNNNQLTNGAGYITSYIDTNTFRNVTAGGNTLGATESLDFVAGTNITISESAGNITINATQRGIDDAPVNGQLSESITSNWAYDHALLTGSTSTRGHVEMANSTEVATGTSTILGITPYYLKWGGVPHYGVYTTNFNGGSYASTGSWDSVRFIYVTVKFNNLQTATGIIDMTSAYPVNTDQYYGGIMTPAKDNNNNMFFANFYYDKSVNRVYMPQVGYVTRSGNTLRNASTAYQVVQITAFN